MYTSITSYIFLILSFLGCTSLGHINTKPHQLSEKPQNMIFAQIDGLGVTHLGALRFGIQSNQDLDYLSSFTCTGTAWPQNFSTMRPSAFDSMNAQIMGSKSMNGTCEDFDLMPFWQRFLTKNKQVVILEIDSNGATSLEDKKSCSGKNITDKLTLLKMTVATNKKAKLFSFKNEKIAQTGVYYDQNCKKSAKTTKCSSTSFENIRFVLEKYFTNNKNTIFIIRDFRYKKLLKRKKYKKAFLYLHSLFSSILMENYRGQEPKNILTLAVGVNSLEMEFPNTSRQWSRLSNGNSPKIFKYSGLQSLALARGSSAENFCGSFFDSDIVARIFFHTERDRSLSEMFQGIIEW